jgi:hypothetical protein
LVGPVRRLRPQVPSGNNDAMPVTGHRRRARTCDGSHCSTYGVQ